jgi:hypothetical protein
MTTTTDYASKINILNDIWINYSEEEGFQDFIEINDLGLPLAHLISNGIVESTTLAEELVNQSFNDLMELFEIDDSGFKKFEEILNHD